MQTLVVLVFKVNRRTIVKRTVEALAIVKDLDEIEDGSSGFVPGCPLSLVYEFDLQRVEETF